MYATLREQLTWIVGRYHQREIARACRTRVGNIYHHFPHKNGEETPARQLRRFFSTGGP